MNSPTDEILAVQSVTDLKAFETLIGRYEGKLLHYIQRISSFSNLEAEEILQEVFIAVWRNLNDYDPQYKFSTWIYRIAHNHTISAWRKQKSRPEDVHLEPDHYEGLADSFDFLEDLKHQETAQQVQQVLERLPEKYRTVLILFYLEDKSYEEISSILQKPIGTVGTLINRAKLKFKAQYQSL